MQAYRAPGGKIAFNSKKGFGDLPLELPCGQCLGCRIERARSWAVRCVHEASLHERNCFLTLTYSPQQLPDSGSLVKEDCQLFLKRMRKACGKFRYLLCGEYGSRTFRPHYHAIIFGLDFGFDRILAVSTTASSEFPLYRSPTLERLWGKGIVMIGEVSFTSAGYVARYTLKKSVGKDNSQYRRIDIFTGEEYFVAPEFVIMSRRPGIGAGWLKKWRSDVYPSDEVIQDGKRVKVPRYYDKLLEREAPEVFESVKAKRREAAARAKERGLVSEERLHAKEAMEISKQSNLRREGH